MKAVILAGGEGKRLVSCLKDLPKPMIALNGKPVLQYQIEVLKKSGITDIILVIGYLGDKIKNYFTDGTAFGVNIEYFEETTSLGTGGALYYLKDNLPPDFLLIFGDLLFDVDFQRLLAFHRDKKALCTLVTHPNDHPFDSDLLILDKNKRITGLLPKDKERSGFYNNCANSGIFVLNQEVQRFIKPSQKQDLEREIIFRAITGTQPVYAYQTTEYIKDIGTPDRFHQVEADLQKSMILKRNLSNRQKAVFLDRDGTLNKYVGLLTHPDQLELYDEVSPALKQLNHSEYITIIITNQPVVARNLCTIDDLENIHRKLETLLGEQGVYVNDIFYCPHHPDRGYPEENEAYKIPCDCRKPKTGLIMEAASKYNIDLAHSFIIGDSTIDIQTGFNAGLKTILLSTGLGGSDRKYSVLPDYDAKNLLDALNFILA